MSLFELCKNCGKKLENNFLYCPWCGISVEQNCDETKAMNLMFDKLEIMQKQSIRKKINAMEQKLDDLENELSVLVLNSEINK